jgi:hypothetical protein
MPSQREQDKSTVHLFIGTGRSLCKITLMPFTFINNYIVILRGLIWLFIFKSVSLSCCYVEALLYIASWSSCPSSWSPFQPSFVLIMLLYTRNLTSKVPVHIFLLENVVKLRFWGPSEAEGPQQQPSQDYHDTQDKTFFLQFIAIHHIIHKFFWNKGERSMLMHNRQLWCNNHDACMLILVVFSDLTNFSGACYSIFINSSNSLYSLNN